MQKKEVFILIIKNPIGKCGSLKDTRPDDMALLAGNSSRNPIKLHR
jgi:hypothetical protein